MTIVDTWVKKDDDLYFAQKRLWFVLKTEVIYIVSNERQKVAAVCTNSNLLHACVMRIRARSDWMSYSNQKPL